MSQSRLQQLLAKKLMIQSLIDDETQTRLSIEKKERYADKRKLKQSILNRIIGNLPYSDLAKQLEALDKDSVLVKLHLELQLINLAISDIVYFRSPDI